MVQRQRSSVSPAGESSVPYTSCRSPWEDMLFPSAGRNTSSMISTVRDPETRDNVNATFSLTSQSVSSTYRVNDLKTELSNQLSQIQRNYVGWKIWQADSRQLLKSDGVYNAYRGVTYDDTVIRGIVHVALVNRSVVTLSFSAPGYYNTSYQRVYNRIRSTIE